MEDRRKFHRDRTYIGASVVFNNRYSMLDCLVRNLSPDGAKIVFSSATPLPGEFDVMIRHKGDSRRARVTWRNETEAGILFLQSTRENVVSIEAAQRIRKLEAQRDALARRVAELNEPA
jgi:hypothetical protein